MPAKAFGRCVAVSMNWRFFGGCPYYLRDPDVLEAGEGGQHSRLCRKCRMCIL